LIPNIFITKKLMNEKIEEIIKIPEIFIIYEFSPYIINNICEKII